MGSGHAAPGSIQRAIAAICAAESGLVCTPGGGIRSSASAAETRRTISLAWLLAGDEPRARIAPLERGGPLVEPQAALLLVGTVALITMLDEDRLNVRTKSTLAGSTASSGVAASESIAAARPDRKMLNLLSAEQQSHVGQPSTGILGQKRINDS